MKHLLFCFQPREKAGTLTSNSPASCPPNPLAFVPCQVSGDCAQTCLPGAPNEAAEAKGLQWKVLNVMMETCRASVLHEKLEKARSSAYVPVTSPVLSCQPLPTGDFLHSVYLERISPAFLPVAGSQPK